MLQCLGFAPLGLVALALSDVAKHEHDAGHLVLFVTNGRRALLEDALGAVARGQGRSFRQAQDRVQLIAISTAGGARLRGQIDNDVEHRLERLANRLLRRPAS